MRFKPITKGLGFHVFSDGLPYKSEKNVAPQLPKRQLAVESNKEQVKRSALNKPTLANTEERETVKSLLKHQTLPGPIVLGKKVKQTSLSGKPKNLSTSYSFFYLPKRTLAFITDTLFHSSICFFLLFILSQHMNIPFAAIQNKDSLILSSIFIFIFNWALILAEEVSLGFTLGKKIFGLKIDAPPFVLLARSILFLIGLFSFGTGLWVAFFTPNKSTWHDIVTRAQPEEVNDL